ncbi:MAG: CapA family protein, partial [Imperialibacter sp.]
MVKIGFTGDFCPWLRVEDLFFRGDWRGDFETVKPFFDENHLNVVDLECPLTEVNVGIEKTGPLIKARPQTAEILRYLNIKVVA